jgi:hypothetical protein
MRRTCDLFPIHDPTSSRVRVKRRRSPIDDVGTLSGDVAIMSLTPYGITAKWARICRRVDTDADDRSCYKVSMTRI